MHVLVVDDDPVVRALVARFLRLAGHTVVGTAEDGVAALELAAFAKPEVVVTDCQMPRLDGIGLAKALRRMGFDSRIVMVSGQSDPALIDTALAAGVDEYLVKPLCAEQFNQAIGPQSHVPHAR
jgi:DNA-binding NarL/FixJ family response regulator